MPTCPFGQLLYEAAMRRNIGYGEVIQLVNAAGREAGLKGIGYTRTSFTRWLTGTVPPAKTQRLLGSVLGIPADTLARVGEKQKADRRSVAHESLLVLRDPDFSNPSLDGPADQRFVELIHRSIQQLVLLDNHFGADDIAGIAVRLFRSVTHRLATGLYQPTIERDLMAAAGEIGELAGWLLFDADRQDAARQLNQDALYWATLAGDDGMVNFILSNVGLQAIHLHRPLEALHVAQRVRDGESRLSPRVRALIHVREGRALALAGQRSNALRDFEKARAFFSDGVRGTDPQWTWWIDDFEITGHEGLCHREAGNAKGAVDLFHRAIETCPPGRARDRFMYHAHLLRTVVDLKDWPEAVSVIDRAAPFVGELASGRVASFLLDATASVRRAGIAPSSVRDGADYLDTLLIRTGRQLRRDS